MFSCSFLRGDKKELVVFVKTSCRFCENEPLFVWKQAVVFMKTSRRFYENEPLFVWKQAVVFVKTSRCFYENKPLLLWKPTVVFVKTSRRFCENKPSLRDVRCVVLSKKFLRFFGEGNERLNRLAIQSIVYCRWRRERQALCFEENTGQNVVLSILCSVWKWVCLIVFF